jgi:hypothetical protein
VARFGSGSKTIARSHHPGLSEAREHHGDVLPGRLETLQPLESGLDRALARDVVVRLVALAELALDQLEVLQFVVDGQDNRADLRFW